ncbi:MAG: hypothetical protein WC980_01615 [Candidatus Brocadiia bacterium]
MIKKILKWAGGIIASLIIPFIFWVVSPNETISLKWFIPICVLCGILIVIVIYLVVKINQPILPEVIHGTKLSPQSDSVLCILNPSKFFSHNIKVSCYYNDEFERLIAIGRVLNIQEDGKIQILLSEILPGYTEVTKKVSENNKSTLVKIIIKPTFPANF